MPTLSVTFPDFFNEIDFSLNGKIDLALVYIRRMIT